MLCGEHGPRPAETYAGTFTGLCYACERADHYQVASLPDGTLRLSYPPHCPSWRRNREEYWAHPDCSACDGAGRSYVSRSDALGGSYFVHCEPCLERVCAVQRANEFAFLREVRRRLADMPVAGDPIAACTGAALAASDQAYAEMLHLPNAYRPARRAALHAIEGAVTPRDLKVKRAGTLRLRFLGALDARIAEGDVDGR